MRLHFYLSSIAVVIALSSASLAAPRDPDLPRLDGKHEWHTIGPSAKTTQSKCIGQTTTPVCAIETAEACRVRRDDRLCKIAAGPFKLFAPDKSYERPTPEQYRVERAFRMNRRNLPSWELGAKHHFRQIGDIEVEIVFRQCDSSKCNPYGDESSTYLLRRIDKRWYVIGQIGCAAADIGFASGGPCSNDWPYGPPA